MPSQISNRHSHLLKNKILSQFHELKFSFLALIWLLCICTVLCFRNFDELQTSGGEIFLCSYTFTCIYSYVTLTALQRTFHDCLNRWKTLIPKSMKWGLPDKMLLSFTWQVFSLPYKAPASTPPGFCPAILLFHLLFLLPLLDMFRKWIQSIM